MLRTTIMNSAYRQTVTFIVADHRGIDFNHFAHLCAKNFIAAAIQMTQRS